MASQYLARLGIVLGVDSGELVQGIEDAKKQFHNFKNQVEKDTKAAAREFEVLKNATEDYGKTLTKVEQIQREIDRGRFMFASQNVKDKLLEQARAYDAQAVSMKKVAGAMTDQQRIQMTYQVTDFVTQIASGQNAMIAFLQQGGQLKDSMGGVGNALRALGTLITPFTVSMAALGTTAAVVGLAFYKASDEMDNFGKSLGITGGYAGLAYGEFLQLGNILQSKTKTAIGDARDVMMSLVESGKFTKTSIEAVGSAILQFSRATGVNGKEAAQKLIPLLDGTAASAKGLNDRYHMLTLAQYQQIEALEKQGKIQESIKLQADLLTEQFSGVERKLGTLQKAWKEVGEWASWAWDKMLNIGREDDTVIQLEKINSEIVKTMKTIAEKRALGMNTQLMDAELEKLKAKFQTTVDKLVEESEAAATKARIAAENDRKISLFAKAGGSEGLKSAKKAADKAEIDAEYKRLEALTDEQGRIQLELQRKIQQIKLEEAEKNEKTFGQFSAEWARERVAKVAEAEAEAKKKMKDMQWAKDLERFNKEADIGERLEREEAKIRADIAAKRDEATSTRQQLDAKFSLIGATQKEIDITMSRIEYQKELNKLQRSQEFKNMAADKQQEQLRQLEAIQKAKEANIELAESFRYLQGMYDAVWSNMASAIETFVRTGKLSIKDFTRSVIQDMLIMNMKLQAMQLVRGLIGSMFGRFAVGGVQGPDNIDVGGGWNPGRAMGGPVSAGTTYLVGERGPELFMPSGSGTIIPNNELGGGSVTNVTNNYINAIDAKSFEQRLLESNQAIWSANQYASKNLATNFGRT